MPARHSIGGSPALPHAPASRSKSDGTEALVSRREPLSTGRNAGEDGGEGRIVASLVARIVNKLPCHSGMRLGIVVEDKGIKSCIQSLLQFARMRVDLVVNQLTTALEALLQLPSTSTPSEAPLNVTQSQAFILYLLNLCLTESWRSHSPSSSSSSSTSRIPSCWSDPPPLADSIAASLLKGIMNYAQLVSMDPSAGSSLNPTIQGRRGSSTSVPWASDSNTGSTSTFFGRHFIEERSTSMSEAPDSDDLVTNCSTPASAVAQMARYTAMIIFYLSSSNWPIVLARIQSRLTRLTTSVEEAPDLVDLRLLEWSNVDKTRLSQIIQEAAACFQNVKRPLQPALASALASAIWVWLEAHPNEYDSLVEGKRRLEGNPDTLFDILFLMADFTAANSRRTATLYPLMALLLVLCPDILRKLVSKESTSKSSKKQTFLDNLRKGLGGSRGYEVSIVCFTQLIQAATCLDPDKDTAGIRILANESFDELKNALFFSPMANEISDPNVAVDGLVALYRWNPSMISLMVLPKLWVGSDNGRIVAVKACIRLLSDVRNLPWHPSISVMKGEVVNSIRNTLKSSVIAITGDKSNTLRGRTNSETLLAQIELASDILTLYRMDSSFVWSISKGSAQHADPLATALAAMTSFLGEPSPESLQRQAGEAIIGVFRDISESNSLSQIVSTSSIWSAVLEISRLVLVAFDNANESGNAVALCELFRRVIMALEGSLRSEGPGLADARNARPALTLATVAALTCLTGSDVEEISLMPRCFSVLAGMIEQVYSVQDVAARNGTVEDDELKTQTRLLSELAKSPSATGRQMQARQLRSTLNSYCRSTPYISLFHRGLIARAANMRKRLGPNRNERTFFDDNLLPVTQPAGKGPRRIEDIARDWQILVSTGSAIPFAFLAEPSPPSQWDVPATIGLPKCYQAKDLSTAELEDHLRGAANLLFSESLVVRETAREVLGRDIPTQLFRSIVKLFKDLLSHSIGPTGVAIASTYTNFVEQITLILRMSIERIGLGESQVDMSELLLMIARYVNRLGREEASLRVKIRFCQLVELVLLKPDLVVIMDSAEVRNTLLDWMSDWSLEPLKDADTLASQSDSRPKLQRDLENTCLRAMIPVTDGLVLQPGSARREDAQPVMSSRLFFKHYQRIVRLLEHSTLRDDVSRRQTLSLPTLPGKPAPAEDRSSAAISILSNLLRANIDVGLKYCLQLGYHEDPSVRIAFMRLMSIVLQAGTRFGGLSSKTMDEANRPYTELVLGSNVAFAIAICEACPPGEADELFPLVFKLFESKGTVLAIMKALIEREVLQTNHESELFRANTTATRMLTIFGKAYGYNYVRATLQPLLISLVDKPAACSFELDPSKAGPQEDIDNNADHLRLICQALLDMICSSASKVPVMFRSICHHIWQTVEARFPESRHSAVGSFVFLRFFCPAIVAPEAIDLDIPSDNREIRRALLLITKVLQNLANNVVFRESHMQVLNPFLSENVRQVTKYMSDIAVRPKSWEVGTAVKALQAEHLRVADPDGDEIMLRGFVNRRRDYIEKALANSGGYGASTRLRPDTAMNSDTDRLRRLLDESVVPSDSHKLSASARSQLYDEFMSLHAGRGTESVADVFYEGPASQNGRRIFYFIMGRVALIDYDLLTYHVFQLLENVTDFFDFVIDMTSFSPTTDLPLSWLKRTLQLCPPGLLPCVQTLALYNPNTYTRRRLRRIISEMSSTCDPVGRTIVAVSSPSELAESIPFTSLALPEYTMALAYEADHVFTNLLYVSEREAQVPVVVKLGQDALQVASWRKQDLTPTLKAYTIDVVRLSDVEDIVLGTGLASGHLTIKHSQNESMTFVSKKRNELAQIIRTARSRLRASPSPDRNLRPSDVPGTLLNVALLNLSAREGALRLASLHLIHEICQFFKYDVRLPAANVTVGLEIPSNSLAFCFSLSQALAHATSNLTLEVLTEWTIGFSKADTAQKTACLHYIVPWLVNLDQFASPATDDGAKKIKQVAEIIRSLASITVAERRRLHLIIHQQVWSTFARASSCLIDIIIPELLNTATDAGVGSERAEAVGEILFTIASTSMRGKLLARLRKSIAQTYLKPSTDLTSNAAWPEICSLLRVNLAISFSPTSALDSLLFFPELLHIITLLSGAGDLLIRQSVYGLLISTLQTLSSCAVSGDMDGAQLQGHLQRAQSEDMISVFGLSLVGGVLELAGGVKDDGHTVLLSNIEALAKFLGQVVVDGAPSIDAANAWRARWMGLVAGTCFQHSPATQPQAFTVLGYLASDEVDDDLVYQVLVAMSTTLSHLSETDNLLVISMLRCLARVIPGLLPESRYASGLFWVGIAILEMGHVPFFRPALELSLVALRTLVEQDGPESVIDILVASRATIGEAANTLDQIAGVSLDQDLSSSLAAVIFKGIRHPSTRDTAVEVLMELLKVTTASVRPVGIDEPASIATPSVTFFIALLPVVAGNPEELRDLFNATGLEVGEEALGNLATLPVFELLTVPDNSFAIVLVAFILTILNSSSSDNERLILYRLLADASAELPEVFAMAYDALLPRLMTALQTSTQPALIQSATTILTNAMMNEHYTFPSSITSESQSSLVNPNYSISSNNQFGGGGNLAGGGGGSGSLSAVLEDMGMKGVMGGGFVPVKMERLGMMAKWVAALIESFTI